jgi:hypothetical protein
MPGVMNFTIYSPSAYSVIRRIANDGVIILKAIKEV